MKGTCTPGEHTVSMTITQRERRILEALFGQFSGDAFTRHVNGSELFEHDAVTLTEAIQFSDELYRLFGGEEVK